MEKGFARSILVFLLASTLCVAVVRAADDQNFPGFIRFNGKVTVAGDEYFMISSQKIELLNITYQGKHYTTTFFSIAGAPIKATDIHKGDVMVVFGQRLPNGSIMAHNIYLQPHE